MNKQFLFRIVSRMLVMTEHDDVVPRHTQVRFKPVDTEFYRRLEPFQRIFRMMLEIPSVPGDSIIQDTHGFLLFSVSYYSWSNYTRI